MATHQPEATASKVVQTEFPLIDNDPHFTRPPGLSGQALLSWRNSRHHVLEKEGSLRLLAAGAVGAVGGFLYFYQRSALRFYGATENTREVDMREMVAKVKAGTAVWRQSAYSTHAGVAARQSRYSSLFMAIMPWFNFVNHNQHGVDTAKYYQQAERELEAERSL
ncbi:unnamed protein product [Parascedosporium putredinis]|uniref:NADH-ubiquinone oxidoreductase 21 kDa subunit n=1 Tax=Parascedosporium putredinis TaxID=1442378 RepID=A0A9P1H284_9PEZI|nr:unnamed protein product [Parascedosporium putredinis]CAI7993737.1 unnamed protein product [Parascedosporium putredinis]